MPVVMADVHMPHVMTMVVSVAVIPRRGGNVRNFRRRGRRRGHHRRRRRRRRRLLRGLGRRAGAENSENSGDEQRLNDLDHRFLPS